jgi:hypothetical protein
MSKNFLILFLFIVGDIFAQYHKEEYPLNLQYLFNQSLNIRVSVARNTDFEGAESIFFEMPSFSFAVFQNLNNKSEMVYSLNPLLWGMFYLINSDKYENSGGGLHPLLALLQGIPNLKLEIVLYKELNLVIGLDTDYLIAKQSLGMKLGYSAGLKYTISQISMKLLYNSEAVGFVSFYEDYTNNAFRIDLSYNFNKDSFMRNIYHCIRK